MVPVGKAASDSGISIDSVVQGRLREQLGLKSSDLRFGLDLARNHLTRGATREAFRVYAALILCEPSNVDFQLGLANCALLIEEPHLALQAASAAIALAPRDARGYLLSGQACFAIGSRTEAVEDLQDAIRFGEESRSTALAEAARKLLDAVNADPETAAPQAAVA